MKKEGMITQLIIKERKVINLDSLANLILQIVNFLFVMKIKDFQMQKFDCKKWTLE